MKEPPVPVDKQQQHKLLKAPPVRGQLNSRLFSPSPVQIGREHQANTPAKGALSHLAATPLSQGKHLRNSGSGPVLARKLRLTPLKDITGRAQNSKDVRNPDSLNEVTGIPAFSLPVTETDGGQHCPNDSLPDPLSQTSNGQAEKKSTSKAAANPPAPTSCQDLPKASTPLFHSLSQEGTQGPKASAAEHLDQGFPEEQLQEPGVRPSNFSTPMHHEQHGGQLDPSSAIEATPSDCGTHPHDLKQATPVEHQQMPRILPVPNFTDNSSGPCPVEKATEPRLFPGNSDCVHRGPASCEGKIRAAVRHHLETSPNPNHLASKSKSANQPQCLTSVCTSGEMGPVCKNVGGAPPRMPKAIKLTAENSCGFIPQSSMEDQSTHAAVPSGSDPQLATHLAEEADMTDRAISGQDQLYQEHQPSLGAHQATECSLSHLAFASPVSNTQSRASDSAMAQAFRQVDSMIPLPFGSEEYACSMGLEKELPSQTYPGASLNAGQPLECMLLNSASAQCTVVAEELFDDDYYVDVCHHISLITFTFSHFSWSDFGTNDSCVRY
jgi:hypothetical protein